LGLGQPANGPYLPGTWPYNPEVMPYPYDPDKAKALLFEAGWKDENGDGILEKENQPFVFTIITNQGNKQRETCALIMQQRLKDVGIDVKVRAIEWAAFLKEFVDKKKFEAVILSWTIPVDPDLYNVFHSSKTREGELNFISYYNEEVDRLIDEGRFTLDREKRRQAYYRIQEILMEDVPYIFLYVPDALPAVASRIHGVEPAPAGITHNFTQWYVPQRLQKYQVEP
jgi:peptide/nickel transport system substrate-binding protein